MSAEIAVRFAGALQLGILSAAALVPYKLRMREQLRPLAPLMRQLVWVYAGFVVLMITSLGLVSLALADVLGGGGPLARALTGFIALFWGVRLALQFFVFDVKSNLTNRLYTLGYHALTVTFAYLTATFAWVTIRG